METMRGAVFYGKDELRVEEIEKPRALVGEAIIRVTLTTICGTDLHIVRGEYPVRPGLVIGHEPVGVIEEIGAGVTGYEVGERVLVGGHHVGRVADLARKVGREVASAELVRRPPQCLPGDRGVIACSAADVRAEKALLAAGQQHQAAVVTVPSVPRSGCDTRRLTDAVVTVVVGAAGR